MPESPNARGVDFTNTKRKPPDLDLVEGANKRVNSLDRKLPFDAGSADFVLSCNVIYHGTLGDVRRRLAEIWRVLKPEALYQGTMLPTRNINYKSGRRTRRRA
jgi:SAM-dependent methyltransferase